mgnify:CR=1 FL=1
MLIEANKVNDCGLYCIDCPNKSLTTEEIPMYANNGPGLSVHCEYVDFCRFLIERIHTTDSMNGIFGGDRRE